MSENGFYWFQLFSAKGVGPKTIHKLHTQFQDHSIDISSIFGAERSKLAQKLRVDSKIIHALDELNSEKLERDYAVLQEQGITLLHLGHPDYPGKLLQRLGDSAPPILFCSGQLPLLSAKSFAVVGSRNVSDEGMRFAKDLGGRLAQAGYNIISGYAKGVDTLAHTAALEKEGTTTIVLSFGILEFALKREFQDLPRRNSILVVSQFPPRQPWLASSAMQRNKLVVGLADAVVVVESGPERDEKGRMSGTFDAAKTAIKHRVPLLVLSPKALKSGGSGNKALIKLGGIEIDRKTAVDTILRKLGSGHDEPRAHEAQEALFARESTPQTRRVSEETAQYPSLETEEVGELKAGNKEPVPYRKKLIEVALPLDAINEGSKPETENPFLKGHPRAIHNWWARTPLSVCRAVLFAQLVDDPGNYLEPNQAARERKKLLDLVEKLATWSGMTDPTVLENARSAIRESIGSDPVEFWDMFAGRGSISLEAQRLGLRVTTSDLNPIAVLIQKALMDIPLRFSNRGPVNKQTSMQIGHDVIWTNSGGLRDDICYYASWLNQEAARRVGELYPRARIRDKDSQKDATVFAWLWARTVPSPNPAAKGAQVPLIRSFLLSSKGKKWTWVEPIVDRKSNTFRFGVRSGSKSDMPSGLISRKGARCLLTKEPIPFAHIRTEAKAGRMGLRLVAIVAEGVRGRVFISPNKEQEQFEAKPKWAPEAEMPKKHRNFQPPVYGLDKLGDLFTTRQLIALNTLCELIGEVREKVLSDATSKGWNDDGIRLLDGGSGPSAYADAISIYLACAISRLVDYCNALCTWNPENENIGHLFQRQAIPMVWDFAESNPIQGKLSITQTAKWVADSLMHLPVRVQPARVLQLDARDPSIHFKSLPVVSTDPPYYDNIAYASLSDFFYVWLRRALYNITPGLFPTLLAPKDAELIATPRSGESWEEARERFRKGFLRAFSALRKLVRGDIPMTVYYAFRQEEEDVENGQHASTGWETMLEGLITSGFQITGTIPVRTTKKARSVARNANALASAVVLVCRPRADNALLSNRREFLAALKKELPIAVRNLQQSNIAPVDLAQTSIGPGMAVFGRYSRILEADGNSMTVRTALQLINQILDEVLTEQEGEFDADTRWALAWFDQNGLEEGPFGVAETLSKAKNTAVNGLVEAGIIHARAGKVRLLLRDELPKDWDPAKDRRLTIWEVVQHLIRTLETGGEEGAAKLVKRLGGTAETARDLAYRLYTICERKKWAQEALAYNTLVIAWPEVTRLAAGVRKEAEKTLFDQE